MLISRGIARSFEIGEAKQGMRGSMSGLHFDELTRQCLRACPFALGRLHQKRLLDEQAIAGILDQGLPIEKGRGVRVVLCPRHASGEVTTEQRGGVL